MKHRLFQNLLKPHLSIIRASTISSTSPPRPKVLEHLRTRSLISIKGAESSDFLQGLITNDMRHFSEGISNIYSLFLNTKGRVLYDVIIYKSPEDDTFLLEVDTSVSSDLQRHLMMYKIRKKIDIIPLNQSMNIWSSFETDFDPRNFEKSKFEGKNFPCGSLIDSSTKFNDKVMIFKDPRIPSLGLRILTHENISKNEISLRLGLEEDGDMSYREFRYRLGIGEGVEDLPPGKPFPLEVNCDYLHGVSFHKGCYIGQELTARTHHTGVVRKRLMPLVFNEIPDEKFNYDQNIVEENGKAVGKFKGIERRYSLGLMRIAEALGARELKIGKMDVKVVKPYWWPVDSPKEKISNVN